MRTQPSARLLVLRTGVGDEPPIRARVVETAINEYLRPFLLGKNPLQIEDTWQAAFVSSYWRNGPVLNNAISGVDMALWDIKGQAAGLPIYELLGGAVRKRVRVYATGMP